MAITTITIIVIIIVIIIIIIKKCEQKQWGGRDCIGRCPTARQPREEHGLRGAPLPLDGAQCLGGCGLLDHRSTSNRRRH